jgi:ABC-2 type transport system permease protein
LLVLVYGVYLLIMLFLSLGVSACCRSSRTALAILLVLWGVTVFAIPRALLDVSGRFYPTPVNVEFWGKLQTDLLKEWGESAEAFKKKLLTEYQVEKVEDLPFDYTGRDMQIGDETAWRVYERFDHQRYDIYDRQSRFLEWGTLIAPAAGVSLLSMALTGNDLPQYRGFTRQVEQHRRTMNTLLNDYISAHQQKNANGWDNSSGVKGDSTLWQSIPAFVYEPPTGWTALRPYARVIALLILWLSAAFSFARFAVARLSGH